jgi:hypothetical protein
MTIAPNYTLWPLARTSTNSVNATLVDDTHTFWSQAQSHETLLSFHPKTVRLQVWQKTTLGVVFCVGNIVAGNWTFTSNLTYLGHFIASLKIQRAKLDAVLEP